MHKMLSDRCVIACNPHAKDPDEADDLEELTSVDECGMEDKTNCEPEGERDAKDHDDVAESAEVKKETDRVDVVCPNPCLPCEETVDSSHNPSVHEENCHEVGNSCVLSGRTTRTEPNLNGHNASQHTEDSRGSYNTLKGRCWLDNMHLGTSHASRKKIDDCSLCEYKGKIEESSEEQIIIHKLPSSLEFTDIVHHSVDDPEVTEVPSDPLDNAVWKIRLIML